MPRVLVGRVEGGKGDAARWLSLFRNEYARKLGVEVFLGSLNLRLSEPFEWNEPALADRLIRFDLAEYGGEREILMLACRLNTLGAQPAHLWTTTRGAADVERRHLIEIIAPIHLRSTFGIEDGDRVEVEIE
jgi:CTP-dependent riboflavin kinase